jgi:CspA family cold shock protein
MTRVTGRVKFFRENGYGFIAPDNGGEDIFVHRSDLHESCRADQGLTLVEGQRVSFDITQHAKGPKAINVRLEQ